ncbi:MAG: hypothetical protein WC745_03215 [Patescibacteria group bacterium]|jgi:hypothetical protein
MAERKGWKKKAQKQFPGQQVSWEGGFLCFQGDCHLLNRQVPGTPVIPKIGKQAKPLAPAETRRIETRRPSQTAGPQQFRTGLRVPELPFVRDYFDLPQIYDTDGECCECGKYPNSPKRVLTIRGEADLYICSECGEQMRPRG